MFKLVGAKDFLRLMTYMKPRMKAYLVGLLGQSIGNAGLYIILAFVLKYLVKAADDRDMSLIFDALKLIGTMLLIVVILLPIFYYFYKKAVRVTIVEIKKELFSKIQKLPIEYFDKNHSGNITSRTTNDILLAEKTFTEGLKEIATTSILGLGSVVIMFILNWKIALSLLCIGCILTAINLKFAEPIRHISDKIQNNLGLLTERFTDELSGFFVIKIFKLGDTTKKKYLDQNEELTRLSVARVNKTAVLDGTNYFLSMIGFGGSLVIGAMMVSAGEIDFSTLAAIVQFQINVSEAFLSIGRCISTMQISLASAGRIFELLDYDEEKQNSDTSNMQNVDEVIQFKNIVFSYNGKDNVLDGISVSIKKGDVVAFVGPSGGGKSTILKLILGFYTASEGELKICGKYISQYSLEELRKNIAYVPQESYLFADTVKENIRYARIDASDQEIIAAAKAANVHDFIETLPNGYDTIIEEGGMNFSGGQRQRIAISRAFLKNSSIVLLDEATSALDSENEYKIQEALETLMKERTVIIVAHRLSTIKKADKIFVVSEGKVKEGGNHDELMTKKGLYYSLVQNQIC
jgi:ABC-type multidrug transport system fused ATPase/permease subunit